MGKLRISQWGLKAVDVIAIAILLALIIRFIAPTSGLAEAIHTGAHLLAQGIAWLAGWIVQFLNWI